MKFASFQCLKAQSRKSSSSPSCDRCSWCVDFLLLDILAGFMPIKEIKTKAIVKVYYLCIGMETMGLFSFYSFD